MFTSKCGRLSGTYAGSAFVSACIAACWTPRQGIGADAEAVIDVIEWAEFPEGHGARA